MFPESFELSILQEKVILKRQPILFNSFYKSVQHLVIKVLSVEKSPILLGFCYVEGGIIINIVCFSVPSWRCKRFWLQRRELNVVWPVKHSVTLVKEHKREKGKMSVSSFENYFLKGILKRLLHSRSAHLHKRWKKSKVPNTLSSLFRAESLYATKKYLGKDAGSSRVAHSKGL